MSALDDVTTAIVAAINQLGTDLSTTLADIKANSGAPTAAQLAKLQDVITALTSFDGTVKASDPGPVSPPAA